MKFLKVECGYGTYYQSGDYFISCRDEVGTQPAYYQAYRSVPYVDRPEDRYPWTVDNRGLFKDTFGHNARFSSLAAAQAAVRKFAEQQTRTAA